MTFQEMLKNASCELESAGIEEASADAWYLLEYCSKMDRAHYFLNQQEQVPERIHEIYECYIEKRKRRIPLQHLTGSQCFCGFDFFVNEHVLIPRQDTECLVEEVLKKIKPDQKILDLCTGSGCIIISIAKLTGGRMKYYGSDISAEALKVARKNAEELKTDIMFYQGDLFEKIEEQFDCIVSNPPYIETEEIDRLMPEVRDYEPIGALDGKQDGLYFYRKIIDEADRYLVSGGWLLFEIGCDQGDAVSSLLYEKGYTGIEVKKDLAGLDRIVTGQRP